MNQKYPQVSIITVTYNAEKYLEQTIKSIMEQDYPNIEYIIIDGASTDGTIDIIKKYEKYITRWISESDNGIYDAMNKGIKLTTGNWINFMNAGDGFSSENILSSIFYKNYNFDVLYSDSYLVNSKLEILQRLKTKQLDYLLKPEILL
jgi:glycosyltransferase involved in cell wall biosynthesis